MAIRFLRNTVISFSGSRQTVAHEFGYHAPLAYLDSRFIVSPQPPAPLPFQNQVRRIPPFRALLTESVAQLDINILQQEHLPIAELPIIEV